MRLYRLTWAYALIEDGMPDQVDRLATRIDDERDRHDEIHRVIEDDIRFLNERIDELEAKIARMLVPRADVLGDDDAAVTPEGA